MANRIKGITIEIGAKTDELNKALKDVDKQLSTTQRNLKDVNKLLKMDPGNTELLTQKQKNLSNAIKTTRDRLKQLKDAQTQVKQGTAEWDSLQREIIATEQDLKSLEKEYKNFGSVSAQQVKVAGEKLKTVGDTMKNIGKDLSMYVTVPLTALGVSATKSFAEVDKTMQLTNSTMGNTAEQAELLGNAMKNAARNSTFGMSDAADAALNFARAGLDATQAANAMAPAMNLAAGEGGNLDTVSSGLVATINGFHDSFEEAGHYADVFANACNNSALDVNSLSEAMSVAAPVFAAAGYSVEDAALYMGIMANNGIEASVAANSLKTGFSRLVDPMKEGAVWLEKFDFSIVDSQGNMKSTTQIQKELHDSFAELSESEQIAAASAIFGKNQMAPWLALINSAPEDVDTLSTSIGENGTATQMAGDMMSGFGGSIEKLKSSLDVLNVTLGETLAQYLQPIIDKIQQVVDWLNQLDPETRNLVVTIGLVAAALGPVLVVVGSLIGAIGQIMIFSPLLVGAIGAVGAALLPIIGIAAGVVAAGVAIYKNWDDICAFAKQLKDDVTKQWGEIKTKCGKFAEETKTTVQNNWNTMKNGVTNAATALKNGVTNTWNSLKSNTVTAFNTMKTTATNAAENIKSNVTNKFNSLKTSATNAFEGLRSGIVSKVENAWNTIKGIADRLKNVFNFSWSLPRPKMPHIDWYWQDIGGLLSIPRFSVSWYKKAYDQPVMFTKPTVLQTPYGMKGFGDGRGGEVVLSEERLKSMAGTTTNTVNIYGADQRSAQAIAQEVQRFFIQWDKEDRAVYA